MGVASKLRRLHCATIRRTSVSIKTQKGETNEFVVSKGVKQEDSLSSTLFNMTVEYITRKINKETIITRGGQIIVYVDDVVLVAKQRHTMTEIL